MIQRLLQDVGRELSETQPETTARDTAFAGVVPVEVLR